MSDDTSTSPATPPNPHREEDTLPDDEDKGSWQEPVEKIIGWLHENGCWTYAGPLEREVRSAVPPSLRESNDSLTFERQAEERALQGVLRELAHLTNSPPPGRSTDQYWLLRSLCRDAIPPVQARIEQLEDWSRQRDREIAEVEACRAILLASPPAPQTETISYTSPLCASDLARLLREKGYLRASDDAVDSWLRRYRTDFPDCYEERNQDDRRRNEPRILYRPEVWPELVRHFAPVTDDT